MGSRSLAWRTRLSFYGAVGALALGSPAFAQSQTPSAQELLDQIRLLQKRIEQLEASEKQRSQGAPAARAAAAKPRPSTPAAKPVEVEATPPVEASSPAPATVSATVATPAGDPDKPNGSFMLGGAKVTLGGYLDLTGYSRSVNENRGTGTGYGTIPFGGPTPQGNTGEFGMSAQATRLSAKIEASVGATSSLVGYGEMDFNNGAGGANSVQSSSYTPRLRQAFLQLGDDAWQAHLLAGQAWSLATPFSKGLDPFKTWQPPTLDTNYMVGYDYLRVPMVRVVKGFDNFWAGIEANTPQTVFGGTSVVPPGQTVFLNYPGNSGLNPQANYSTNVAPDLIAKVALDTRFGHVEAFGLMRWFQSQLAFGTTSVNNTAFGGGVGASAFVPIGPWADVMASVLYGNGVGRYGASGLPDVTFNANGGLAVLPEGMGTVGIVGHVVPKVLDVYAFYGWDWIGASYFPRGGYGNPTFDNTGCFNPNAAASGQVCTGNTQSLNQITAGVNWNVLRGRYGTFRTGLQYGHITRTAYAGFGGTPSAAEDLFMFNFRYLPFE